MKTIVLMEYHGVNTSWKVFLHKDGRISFWNKNTNSTTGAKYAIDYLFGCLSGHDMVIDYVMTEDDVRYVDD